AAAPTAAEAGGRFFAFPFCHRGFGGLGNVAKPAVPASIARKVANPRPSDDDVPVPPPAPAKRAQKPRPAVEPPATVASGKTITPAAAATKTCLTKEYLDTGAVMFRDVCTNEWAINSTDVNNKTSSTGRTCLTK